VSRRIAVDLLLACLLLWVLPECTAERWEGQYAGECSDDADNDADSLYDCNDPDCAGAPACQGDDDDVADDDSADDDSADDDDSGGPAVGDDDDSALGPCRPVDHLWDPATEPLRLPCEPTWEPCNNKDDDLDGFLDPKCGTESCNGSIDCTMGGLMPDADCNQNDPGGPVCTWIDGVPPVDSILDCMGMLCPPDLKCVQGECVVPGDGLPYTPCESGSDCPINAGCLAEVVEGTTGWCTWFCQDFPCPDGFSCQEYQFQSPHTGQMVSQLTCNPEDEGEGSGLSCLPSACPDCVDEIDNDGDGLIDCEDDGCSDWCGQR